MVTGVCQGHRFEVLITFKSNVFLSGFKPLPTLILTNKFYYDLRIPYYF